MLDRAAAALARASAKIPARVRSLVLDDDSAIVFVRADGDVAHSFSVGEALKQHLRTTLGKGVEAVYWKFPRAARATLGR